MTIELLSGNVQVVGTDMDNYKNQKSKEVGLITDSNNRTFRIQDCGNEVFLGPTEVFFNQTDALNNRNATSVTDALNQNKDFTHIGGLRNERDTMFWSFYLGEDTPELTIYGSLKTKNVGAELAVTIDNSFTEVITLQDAGDNYCFVLLVKNLREGKHDLEMTIRTNDTDKSIAKVYYLKLVNEICTTVTNYAVRERWRPSAAHAKFYYNNTSNKTRAWVMEIKKEPSLSCFSPMTAPFGYYGPVFSNKETDLSTSVNFSLWSFGKNDPEPPQHQFSRILAIGSPDGDFGEFTHEGTGVKIRNFNPWEKTNISKNYIMALRFEEDESYYNKYGDGRMYTFYSYFWNEIDSEWNLYGIGQTYFSNSLNTLNCGSFVEVPGVAETQRTNHIVRKVTFKGYRMGLSSLVWNKLNKMKSLYYNDEFTNKNWAVEGDKFVLSAGGLEQKYTSDIPLVNEIPDDGSEDPPYMNPDKLKVVEEFTLEPKIVSATINTTNKTINIGINVPLMSLESNTLTVYYGESDGLSIDRLWDGKQQFTQIPSGTTVLTVNYVDPQPKYVRILVQNDTMQVWSFKATEL